MEAIAYEQARPRYSAAHVSGVVGPAAVVTLLTLLGTGSGFLREVAIALRFGASRETDAYLTALFIPGLLQQVLLTGSLTAVLVPVLSRCLERGETETAWGLVVSAGGLLFVLLALIGVVGVVLAPVVVTILAPGFDESTAAMTVNLTRAMFPLALFFGLTAYGTAVLNAHLKFAMPALAPFVFNAGAIISALVLGAMYGMAGLAAGTVVAGVAQLALLGPSFARIRQRRSFSLGTGGRHLRRAATNLLPALATAVSIQMYFVLERVLASHLGNGAVSSLSYAYKIALFPSAFAFALVTVSFPSLSRYVARGDIQRFASVVTGNVRILVFIGAPIAVLMATLSGEIVEVILQRGAFTGTAAALTASALRSYVIALPLYGIVWLLIRALNAFDDFVSPLLAHLAAVSLMVPVAIGLSMTWGVPGLALGQLVVTSSVMLLLYYFLRRRAGPIGEERIAVTAAQVGLAAALMWVAIWGVSHLLRSILVLASAPDLVLYLSACTFAGATAYVLAAAAMRMKEMGILFAVVLDHIRRPVRAIAGGYQR